MSFRNQAYYYNLLYLPFNEMKIRFSKAFLMSPMLFDNVSSTLFCETCNICPAIEFKILVILFNAFFIAVCVTEFILKYKGSISNIQ